MKLTLATKIIADIPTSNGCLYTRDVLEGVIKQFNIRAHKRPVLGSELKPDDISHLGEPAFVTHRLFINESGAVCADIEILDNESGKSLQNKIGANSNVIARPIMCVPSYVNIEKKHQIAERGDDVLVIHKINSIVRIQVECHGEPTGSNKENDVGGAK